MNPTAQAITLLTEKLPRGLQHPGDNSADQPAKLVPLPALSSTGIPQEMNDYFADQAGLPASDAPKIIAEAIIHTLTNQTGLAIVATTELAELKTTAKTIDSTPGHDVAIHCRCNPDEPIIVITANRPSVTTDGKLLTARIAKVCKCP